MKLFKRLWYDDDGFVFSVELLLILTLVVLGLTAGLIELRNAINEQFIGIADTIRSMNPTTTIPGLRSTTGGSVGNRVFDAQVQTEGLAINSGWLAFFACLFLGLAVFLNLKPSQ